MKKFVLFATASLLVSNIALSAPKPNVFDGGNEWLLTFFDDDANTHTQWGTQRICFMPYIEKNNSIQGVWYSTSFHDWNGRYYQEGDEVKMTGDYAKDVGHDHMTLQHTTVEFPIKYGLKNGLAFKDWTEWREDGKYGKVIGWGNARMIRTGKKCGLINLVDLEDTTLVKELSSEALNKSHETPERLTTKGEVAQFPAQPDLESIEEYDKRTK